MFWKKNQGGRVGPDRVSQADVMGTQLLIETRWF